MMSTNATMLFSRASARAKVSIAVRAGLDQAIDRTRPTLRGLCRHGLVRNKRTKPGGGAAFRRKHQSKISDKLLAYNYSPSFNWKKKLDGASIGKFQRELGTMGYKFQFVTLAGFHALNYSMFSLAHGYQARSMSAYSELQEAEFVAEADGYTATKHQREVGTGYFDDVARSSPAAAQPPRSMALLNKNSFINGKRRGLAALAGP